MRCCCRPRGRLAACAAEGGRREAGSGNRAAGRKRQRPRTDSRQPKAAANPKRLNRAKSPRANAERDRSCSAHLPFRLFLSLSSPSHHHHPLTTPNESIRALSPSFLFLFLLRCASPLSCRLSYAAADCASDAGAFSRASLLPPHQLLCRARVLESASRLDHSRRPPTADSAVSRTTRRAHTSFCHQARPFFSLSPCASSVRLPSLAAA